MITDNGIEYDTKTELRAPAPCGESVTTTYRLTGKLVRQDVEIIVSPEALSIGSDIGNVA